MQGERAALWLKPELLEKKKQNLSCWVPPQSEKLTADHCYRKVSVGSQGPRAVWLLALRCQTSEQPGFHDITSRQTPGPCPHPLRTLSSSQTSVPLQDPNPLPTSSQDGRKPAASHPTSSWLSPGRKGKNPRGITRTPFTSNKNSGRGWQEKGRQVRDVRRMQCLKGQKFTMLPCRYLVPQGT